jgi:hypothetical protein
MELCERTEEKWEYRIVTWDGEMLHNIVAYSEKQAMKKNGTFTTQFTKELKLAFKDAAVGFKVHLRMLLLDSESK